jgi:hypothetical protein
VPAMRRNRVVLSLIAVTVALGVVGCANAETGAPDTAAKDALTAALRGIEAGNYTFTRTGIRGAVHLPDSSLIEQPEGGPSVLRTGSAFYLRYALHGPARTHWAKVYAEAAMTATGTDKQQLAGARKLFDLLDGEQWVEADETKIKAAADGDDQSGLEYVPVAPTTAAPDVTGATALITAVTTAEQSGDTITGTLDATTVDPAARILTNDSYYVYGPKASAMPFRATLDDQGRLIRFILEIPGQLEDAASAAPETFPSDAPAQAPEEPVTIAISGYGETAAPAAPENAPELVIDAAAHDTLSRDID